MMHNPEPDLPSSVASDAVEHDAPASTGTAVGLTPSESMVSEVVGRLIEFWGFKKNMGRVWAVLYLSPTAQTAHELRDRLSLSAGAVSMTLNDLLRWGVVKKVWVQGDRRDFFTAEVNLWRMISRVLAEREKAEIAVAIETFERSLQLLAAQQNLAPAEQEKAKFQVTRIEALLQVARMGKALLETLVTNAKVDAEPLATYSMNQSNDTAR